jgi:exopolysaccharide biosynthesis protein
MKKSFWIIVSSIYGVAIAALTGANLYNTFLATSVVSVSETSDAFNFDDSSSSSSSSGTSSTSSGSTSSSTSSTTSTGETTVALKTLTYTGTNGTLTYHIVDINLKKLSNLRTHLATSSSGYPGVNVVATTGSQISAVESSSNVDVLSAINGDYCYYSSRDGYVIRNGTTYRSTKRDDYSEFDDFAIFKDGSILSYSEGDYTCSTIESMNGGCYQNFCFGPSLVKNGTVAVTTSTEVDTSSSAGNPRTAIGFINSLHYVFFVSEGRTTSYPKGFTLYQVASVLSKYGCSYAYNLDGGGSSTLYYEGSLVNLPCNNGGKERSVSDIVYVVNA